MLVSKKINSFSVFRAGSGSSITFEKVLNVDVSGAIGGLSAGGSMSGFKTIFDISQGAIYVNPDSKNNDVILKGDIFSSGTLVANFLTSSSTLIGKIALRDSSSTKFHCNNKSKGNAELDLANQAKLTISMDEHFIGGGGLRWRHQGEWRKLS